MDYIYLACINRIKSLEQLFTDAGLKPVQHFDFFKNQYIYPELHHVYKKPALFFEYRVAWRDKDRLVQEGDAELRFHLELENYAASFDRSKNQETALMIFKYHRLLKGCLHGFVPSLEGSGVGSRMGCISEDPDLNPTTTNVHIITFKTKVTDDIALQIEQMGIEETQGDDVSLTRVDPENIDGTTDRYVIDN
jgi:hypothetical protein